MFEKFKPLGDRVLVKRLAQKQETDSGIIIPDAAKEKAQTGSVIAVGSGRVTANGQTVPLDVKVGDTVYFGKYSGTEADTEYVIMKEDEILGVVQQ